MIDLEAYLVPKIAERCKKLRVDLGFPMERISDRSDISRIERGKIRGNFITETVLLDYTTIFDKAPEEIIFGSSEEFEETLKWLFTNLFKLINLKDLTTDSDLYEGKDNIDIESQKAMLSMAETFAEYNIKRYNFLKSDEIYMDNVSKKFDYPLWIGGKIVNIERDFRINPINEETVIDLFDMRDKMWLMCRKKIISSFRAEIIDKIFNKFDYSKINSEVRQWILGQFNKIIIPDVVAKLKSNMIFKIGFMVKSLIDEFLDEDLAISFQNTIPLQTTKAEHYKINISSAGLRGLSEAERIERAEIISVVMKTLQKGDIPDAKLLRYGITFSEVPETISIKEVEIDDVINRAVNNRGIGRTLKNPRMFEESPIFETSDFNSQEEVMAAMEDWYNDKHFKNQNIPGYLTNNSQIVQRLQERMNKDIHESIDRFIDIQNNLLKLLTDEELIHFSK
ncbi:hypothetical protein CSE16_17600 [Solibacillus sp. R5-41]|uniref:hypothetical protein n=1 Tax=Solibacillus sp. R5-41 TaxID=2048654 RepID=UPI000C127507|nr:hypothetical protein [Solibacillus sp. R5-41]ATP41700.1 hypothetical protein CSE16_17600 [Solibacillus sp. R5-41]